MTNIPGDNGDKKGVLQKAGWWFWLAVFLGLAIRIYLVVFTQGSLDAEIWEQHAKGVHIHGLTGYYHINPDMNHPPLISFMISGLWDVSQAIGIPFRILLRAPFAVLDGATTVVLMLLFYKSRFRYAIGACYWLHPLAMIFSSFHGNTDSAIAFFLLLAVLLLSREKMLWAAIAVGMGFWVKLPVILAMPAFVFFVQGWRRRLLFLAVVGITGISAYVPSFLIDPLIIYKNVFGYHGQIMKTAGGIRILGSHILVISLIECLPPQWQQMLYQPAVNLFTKSWLIALLLIVFFSWLRRTCRTIDRLGVTIAGVYTILYGFSCQGTFQYFAWSIPFWFFVSPFFCAAATVLAGGYICTLYWLFCAGSWLLGSWRTENCPQWPDFVLILRDLTILFFFISACIFLFEAVYRQIVGKPIKEQE